MALSLSLLRIVWQGLGGQAEETWNGRATDPWIRSAVTHDTRLESLDLLPRRSMEPR